MVSRILSVIRKMFVFSVQQFHRSCVLADMLNNLLKISWHKISIRVVIAALFSGFLTLQVAAQTEISGRVLDSESGGGLPSATILLDGTYRGTISNSSGYFQLQVEKLPATLQVRYIGFETTFIEVTDTSKIPVEIILYPSVSELGEIVVTDKDPGLSIMELVIERKKLWRRELTAYSVSAYTRQVLSNDTSIVSITESSSIAYWDEEKGHKEIQLSRTQTSNISESDNFAGVSYMPNFYDDDILIAGYNMVGITHPEAVKFYQFRLLETLQMDGKPVYRIEVIPRRNLQPLFEGEAWVLGRDYALLEIDLKPNEVVHFPPPIQDFNLAYRQQFSNYGRDFWLPVDMRIEGLIRIGMVGLRFPAISFRQTSRLSDYQINPEIPDSVFAPGNQITRVAQVKTDSLPVDRQPIPLTTEEVLAYENIDSTQTLEEAFRPEGFLARMIEVSEDRDRSGRRTGIGRIVPDGLSPMWRYNRIEGHHVGLKFRKNFNSAGLRTETFGGYSFHSAYWDAGFKLRKRILNLNRMGLNLFTHYEAGTATRYESSLYTNGMNSIQTFLGGVDYFDYYRNEQLNAGLQFRRILSKTDLTVTFQSEKHSSFEPDNLFDNSLFGWHNRRRDHPEITEGNLRSLQVEIGYNVSEQNFGFAGNRQIRLLAEYSDEILGSDFSFERLALTLDWNFNTFYPRRLFTNTLDIHLRAGTYNGEIPYQRVGVIDGSMSYFSPFGTLKTRRNLPYEGSEYWLFTAEHNFRTIPFELLGLRKIVEKGWGVILFGGAGYTRTSSSLIGPAMDSDGIHSEIGFSLNSLFGIMRVDFAKRMDQRGSYIGFSVPRYF